MSNNTGSNLNRGVYKALIEDRFLVLSILTLALTLRLYGLENQSLWVDEIGQVLVAKEASLLQVALSSVRHDGSTPLDYLITHIVLLIGDSEGILRLPSVLWGVLAVYLTYKISRNLYDKGTALFSAFLLSITPIHIYYSQEVRFYSLSVFMILLFLNSFVTLLIKQEEKWHILTLVGILALYAHYYAGLVFLVLVIWSIKANISNLCPYLRGNVLKRLLLSLAISILAFLPWVFYDFYYLEKYQDGINRGFSFIMPSPITLLESFSWHYPRIYEGSVAWLVFLGLGLFIAILQMYLSPGYNVWDELFLYMILIGIAGVLILDKVGAYFFAPRQLIVFLPYLLLMVSRGWVATYKWIYAKIQPKYKPALVFAIVMIFLFILSSLKAPLYSIYKLSPLDSRLYRQDWKNTAAFLNDYVSNNDAILTTHPFHLKYYLSKKLAPKTEFLLDDPQLLLIETKTHERVWLITTNDRLRIYPSLNRWLSENQDKVLDLSFHANLKLYLISQSFTADKLLRDMLPYMSPIQIIVGKYYTKLSPEDLMSLNEYDLSQSAIQNLWAEHIPLSERINYASKVTSALLASNPPKFDLALQIIRNTLKKDPANIPTLFSYGYLLTRQNKIEEAIQIYEQIIRLQPNNYLAHYLIAKRYYTIGNSPYADLSKIGV